jgi:hypothetical protein
MKRGTDLLSPHYAGYCLALDCDVVMINRHQDLV